MKSVKGIYDGNQITFDEPITVPPNTPVIVTFLTPEKPRERSLTVDDFLGCVHYTGPVRSLEDMEEGIRQGALESARSS